MIDDDTAAATLPTAADGLPLAPVLVEGRTLPVDTTEVRNPARAHELVGHVAMGGAAEADAAMTAAQAAFPGWAGLSIRERAEYLVRAADALEAGAEARTELLVREVGKVRGESAADVAAGSRLLRYFAGAVDELAELFGEGRSEPGLLPLPGRVDLRHIPMGPVVVVAPWNTPVLLTFMGVAPALLAGNTVVVKPPEEAPLALTDALVVLASVLPTGVLGIVPGAGADAGAALTSHPLARKVMFTGSIETGKVVMRAAAGHLAGVSMELGGNDPAILLDDVVVDENLLREIVGGVFALSGQVCYNIKRIYVHESRYDEFVAALVRTTQNLVVGDPQDPATTIGPVATRAGRDRLAGLADRCRAAGATVTEVGAVPGPEEFAAGYFVRPAVVTGIPQDHELVVTEQFGPIVPVLPFRTDDEAVALANGTEYGLAASVWSADRDRARALGLRLEAGSVFVNVHRVGASPMSVPFGGVKQSGIGRSHGVASVLSCTESQAVVEFDDPGQIAGAGHWAVLTSSPVH